MVAAVQLTKMKFMIQWQTRAFVLLAIFLSIISFACGGHSRQSSETLRVGYQKWSTFSILKASGKLT
jgi:hypothetical protein